MCVVLSAASSFGLNVDPEYAVQDKTADEQRLVELTSLEGHMFKNSIHC